MVRTGGRIRGVVSRWLMRIQAIQGIIQIVTMSVTAASTLTFALQSLGLTNLAPVVLGAGLVGTPLFAYVYTEWGLFNRKNRERSDRGANWAGPDTYMNSVIGAMGTFVAFNGRPPDDEEFRAIQEAVWRAWQEFRDGVDFDE